MKLNNHTFLRNNIYNFKINYNLINIKFNSNYLLYNINLIDNKFIKLNILNFNNILNLKNFININKIYFLNIYFYIFNIFFNYKLNILNIKNLKSNEYYLSNLIKYYLKKNINIKKISKNIYIILNNLDNIKGFKLIFKGRFKDSLRKIKKSFIYGKLNLQTLKYNIVQFNFNVKSYNGLIGIKLILSKI